MATIPNNTDDEKTLAYDLRQVYVKIVGEHMLDIAEARKGGGFYSWFKALEDLHTICRFKFKDPEGDEKEYKNKKNKIIDLANKYISVWRGENQNPMEVAEIEAALRDLEEFIYIKMNEGNMFGSRYLDDDDGL